MKLPLSICFKGARDYIHGTDMLNAAAQCVLRHLGIAQIEQVNFMINRMTAHKMSIKLVKEGGAEAAATTPVATLTFEADGASWLARLEEEEGQPDCRYPYDEESIVACCRVDADAGSIRHEGRSAHTPIEVIVAMTKALHLARFPDSPGKWVFCRWEGEHWPLPMLEGAATVTLTKSLGSRLTKSTVMLGNGVIGSIYFSAKVK